MIETPNQIEIEVDAMLRDVLALAAMAPNTLAHGTQNERREMLGKVCNEIKLADRKLSVELRRPYSVLFENLPTVLSQLRDSNPSKTSQNSNIFNDSHAIWSAQFANMLPIRNTTEPNPQICAQQNKKTAPLFAKGGAILSWWARRDSNPHDLAITGF